MSDAVDLFVEGGRLSGWKSVSVTRSIETIANGFTLSMSELSLDDPGRRLLQKGDACEVRIGDEIVIAGYIRRLSPSYSGGDHSIEVGGFDATADLVRASILRAPRTPARLEDIVAELCEPFGISVSIEVDTGDPFERFDPDPGEEVFSALDRLARYRGVVLASDGIGGLRILLPGAEDPVAEIRHAENVLEASAVFDDAQRHSEITFQGTRSSSWGGEASGAPISATATDPAVGRYLPLLEIAEDPPENIAALEGRAQREVNLRAARGQRATFKVEGWRTHRDAGPLWLPGSLVSVRDAWLGIDRDLLLTSATLELAGSAQTTRLDFLRPEAFDLRKLEAPAPSTPEFWGPE